MGTIVQCTDVQALQLKGVTVFSGLPMTGPRIRLAVFALAMPMGAAAQSAYGVPLPPPPDRPIEVVTAEVPAIRVVPVVAGLEHPWGMAFRRNGDILVTERETARLRIVRDGQLLDHDVTGVPEVYTARLRSGLMDVAVHPDDDALVYLTYSKPIDWEGSRGFTGGPGPRSPRR